MNDCPLCGSREISALTHNSWPSQSHGHCHNCNLIFLRKELLLDSKTEKSRYDLHNNDLNEPEYRKYLLGWAGDLVPLQGLRILDFGCGPSENLATLLREQHLEAESYDPVFGPPLKNPFSSYDYIFAIEVFEHFYNPKKEFLLLEKLLSPQGQIKAVTRPHPGPELFPNWWYARDPTHVVFYSPQTARWIDQNFVSLKGRIHWPQNK